MTFQPPAVGPTWPAADRLAYIHWLANLTLHRIDLDNPAVPLLSKRPIRDLFWWVALVAAADVETLDRERARVLREYDPADNYNSVEVPAEWLAVLAELQERDRR